MKRNNVFAAGVGITLALTSYIEYTQSPEFAHTVDSIPSAAASALGWVSMYLSNSTAPNASASQGAEPSASSVALQTSRAKTAGSQAGILATANCPKNWIMITPADTSRDSAGSEYNGLVRMRNFTTKPNLFPKHICVATPVPKAKESDAWNTRGGLVTAFVTVPAADQGESPCPADISDCFRKSPSSLEVPNDLATGGVHGFSDGSHPGYPSVNGLDMSNMPVRLIYVSPNGVQIPITIG